MSNGMVRSLVTGCDQIIPNDFSAANGQLINAKKPA